MPVPISLIVDDGSPVNAMYWEQPEVEHPFLVPNSFARRFANVCARHGVRGKLSVLPMPCCLGRIDQRLAHVSPRHLADFLRVVRTGLAPHFDITPEILTHLRAYRIGRGGHLHTFEDDWVAQATVPQITEYIALALRVLQKVGLPANGVTSPWMTGERNEKAYAEAIGRAQWRVHRRKLTWYFLHYITQGRPRWPIVTWANRKTGQKVVSVVGTTGDPFSRTQCQHAASARAARAAARAGVDAMLSADGQSGRLREVFDLGGPAVIVTHWQSLFSDGNEAGLDGFQTLLFRVEKVFGREFIWMRCSELAATAVSRPGRNR